MAYEKKKNDESVKILKNHIKEKNLAKLYVFCGEESYLKEYYRKTIEKMISTGGFDSFNIIYLDDEAITEDSLADAIESLPFGAEKKLIVLRDPQFGWASKFRKPLPEVFASLPDYVCMILYYQAIEYKPDKRMALYKSIEKNGVVVEFNKARGAELVNWLRRRFAANNKAISPADCDYIIFLCGSLMTNLITEVDKISSYAKGDTVTRDDINAVASRVLDASVFDLTDCVAAKDYQKAITIYRDLIEAKNEPISILAALIRQVQRIYAAALALQSGKGEKYIAELYGFRSSYPARLLIDAARRTTVWKAAQILDICCNADTDMKSNIPDPTRTLEIAILRMAQLES